MGAVGGGLWHFVKGMKNSPSGYRVRGALEVRRPKGTQYALITNSAVPYNCLGNGALPHVRLIWLLYRAYEGNRRS